ncbi:winged helix-turn-helix domain-containing protein [Kribbella antibiotica]|uniref:winged helix-turn-helix domain-containing protein n=1 Tax=Kribbella antibiotica TaxID=190195 RepID=UPI00192E2D89|nr:winged helix-turn-helix domain-containing protein [Kribbella antibiotica]
MGELLARFYLDPDRRYTLTELAKELDVSLPTIAREVDRMRESGLLTEERVGRARVVWANRRSVLYEPLSLLVALTYGPRPVLEQLLSDVAGVDSGLIYGSWAARYQGEPGAEPNDVDVLVIGAPDPDQLFDIADEARRRLRREVSIRSVKPSVWTDADPRDPFLKHVKSRPMVELDLKGDAV